MGPCSTLVLADEQAGRLDAGIKAAVASGEAPNRLDGLLAWAIGKPLARMGPARPEISGLPDGRAEPFVAAPGVDGPRRRIGDDVVHRPRLAVGTPKSPGLPIECALQDEGALLGPE